MRRKLEKLTLSTPEQLAPYLEPGSSKAVPVYLLPLHERNDKRSYSMVVEFWARARKFHQLAVWWFEPDKEVMSQIVLSCHTQQVLTMGNVSGGVYSVRALRMPAYPANERQPARPAYDLWPIWPFIDSFTSCDMHGGVSFQISPPRMATHINVSASLSTCMVIGFTNKKI